MRNGTAFPEIKTFLHTPPIIKLEVNKKRVPDGIIISHTNTRFVDPDDQCITIFMGHGTGDRKYGGSLRILEDFDYHFISGPKHLEKLYDSSVRIPKDRIVKIGNPRFDDYINGTIDLVKCYNDHNIVDLDRKTILYAPTWKRGNGTLHRFVYRFCRELTKEFNLIIRPHYFEAKFIPIIKMWVRANRLKHVYFSHPADILRHDTMSDFAISDLLISDTSSIIYEYLITGKPIIIAETNDIDIHNMPGDMDIQNVADVYDGSDNSDILKLVSANIEENRNKENYQNLLSNCFYFNDGRSTDRAVDFITMLQKQ